MDDFQFEYDQKKKTRLKKGPICVLMCIICLMIGGVAGYFIHGFQMSYHHDESDIYNEIAQILMGHLKVLVLLLQWLMMGLLF